jgi:hypothetical protein
MSTYWGVRVIPGIYQGCEVNPSTMVYHHIITDGKTIFSSPNRIKGSSSGKNDRYAK